MAPPEIHDGVTSIESNERSALETFRTLVQTHAKTKDYDLDDKMLLKFLRSRDLDPHQAHKVLAGFTAIVNERPDIFSWTEEIKKVTSAGIYYHYPIKHTNGPKIIVTHPGKWIPGQIKFESMITQTLFFDEISLMDEDVQKDGLIVVIDMRGLGLTHIYNVGISNAKLASDLTDKFLPLKILNLHVVYENRLTDIAYSLFKPFLDAKLKQRIIFHGHDLQSLYNYVPRFVLPPSLGGTNQEFSWDYYNQILEKDKDLVLEIWEKLRKKNKKGLN